MKFTLHTMVIHTYFLGTTAAGATSYIDTTCKQNASVVYRIRAKKGGAHSEYVTTSAINTPLCLKTDQSTLTTLLLSATNISSRLSNIIGEMEFNTVLSALIIFM